MKFVSRLVVLLSSLFFSALSIAAASPQVTFLGTAPVVLAQPPIALSAVSGLGVDAAGNAYYADAVNGSILRVAADGTRSTLATGLSQPKIAVDYAGNVYVADTGNNRILTIAAGTSTAIERTSVAAPSSIAADVSGNSFYISGGSLYQLPRGGASRKIGSYPGAKLVAYGPASGEDDTIYILSANGSTYTVSTYTYHNETGTTAKAQAFTSTDSVTSFVIDAAANLIFTAGSGSTSYIFQVSPSGQRDQLTQISAGVSTALAVNYNRVLYYVDGNGLNKVMKTTVSFGSLSGSANGLSYTYLPLFFSVPRGITVSSDSYTKEGRGDFTPFSDGDYPYPGSCGAGIASCLINIYYFANGVGLDTATMKLLDPSGNTLFQTQLYARSTGPVTLLSQTNLPASKSLEYTTSTPGPKLKSPAGLAVTNSVDSPLVADPGTGSLLTLGSASAGVSGLGAVQAVARHPSDSDYVTQSGLAGVLRIADSGVRTRIGERLVTEPNGVATDDAGNVYISDRNSIFRVGIDGTETQQADPSTDGGYERVESLAVSGSGDVYAFFNYGGPHGDGGLIKISPAGVVSSISVPDVIRSATGLGIDDGGGIYFGDGISRTLTTLRTDGSFLPLIHNLKRPKGVSGFGKPLIVDQGAATLYTVPSIPFNSDSFGGIFGDSTIDFGDVPVGTTITKTFSVFNVGDEQDSFGGILYQAPDFSLPSGNELSIEPGGAGTFSVAFTPSAVGPSTTKLIIDSSDVAPIDLEFFIYLRGNSVAAPGKK